MTAQPSTDPVRRIMSMLAGNVDELAQHVASAVRAEVDFYKSTRAVADDDLLASCTENIRFALKSLEDGVAFDTLPAATTGSRRAAAGVPLPAVMDAYRVASYCLWDAVVDIATEKRGVSRDVVIEATRRIWRFQNLYTDAMASAYRQQNMQQVLEDEAERAALTEAWLDGRTITDYSVWEVAQLLRLPLSGPLCGHCGRVSDVGQTGASWNQRPAALRRHLLRVAPAARHSGRHRPDPIQQHT